MIEHILLWQFTEQAKAEGAAEKLAQKICKITSRTVDEKLHFHYEYIEAEQTARFTVFGAPSFVAAVMEVLS